MNNVLIALSTLFNNNLKFCEIKKTNAHRVHRRKIYLQKCNQDF